MKILAFAGSLRRGSYNKLLLNHAVEGARTAGAQVTLIDLRDFPLPLYDGDLEEASGLPEHALALKALFNEATGLLIATPEYNHGMPAVLKNALDWVSRRAPGEGPLHSLKGRHAGLLSASIGAYGGYDSMAQLRSILWWLRVTVLPEQLMLPFAGEAFDEEGRLKDERRAETARTVGRALASL